MLTSLVFCLSLLAPAARSATTARAAEEVRLFERVVRELADHLYDPGGARNKVLALARTLRPELGRDSGVDAQRALVQRLLEQLGVSHLALYSEHAYAMMTHELSEEDYPTLGFQLVEEGGEYYADWIYEDGPAAQAGLRRGERVLAIDGLAVERSPRLDWRSDDAALPDPAVHALLCEQGEVVALRVADAAGYERVLRVSARASCGAEASRASATIYQRDGLSIGYLHLWYMSSSTPSHLLASLIAEGFDGCDALVLDLRGRGGYESEVVRVLEVLERARGGWRKPLVALVHGGTRSAKEILAQRLHERELALLVGEHTAGAVVPASFTRVGDGAVLMYPRSSLGRTSRELEGAGVAPDVLVEAPLAHADGADPILDAGLLAARVWCEALAEGAGGEMRVREAVR